MQPSERINDLMERMRYKHHPDTVTGAALGEVVTILDEQAEEIAQLKERLAKAEESLKTKQRSWLQPII